VAYNAGFDVAFLNAELKHAAKLVIAPERVVGAGGMKARWAISAYGGLDERDSARRTTRDWRIQDDSLRALSDSAT
jgi:hypothetical protein